MVNFTKNIVISYGTLINNLNKGSDNIIQKYHIDDYILIIKMRKIFKFFVWIWLFKEGIIPDRIISYNLFKPKYINNWYIKKIKKIKKDKEYIIIIDDDPQIVQMLKNISGIIIMSYDTYEKTVVQLLKTTGQTINEYKFK